MARKLAQGCYLVQGRLEAFNAIGEHLKFLELSKIDETMKARALRTWSLSVHDVPSRAPCIITLIDYATSGIDNRLIITELY